MEKTSSRDPSSEDSFWQTTKRPSESAHSDVLTLLTKTQCRSSIQSEHSKILFRKKRQFSNITKKTRPLSHL